MHLRRSMLEQNLSRIKIAVLPGHLISPIALSLFISCDIFKEGNPSSNAILQGALHLICDAMQWNTMQYKTLQYNATQDIAIH